MSRSNPRTDASRRRALRVLAVTLGALSAAGLAGCTPLGAARTAADRPLAPWEARGQELFDDNIDASALGLSMDGASPRSDPFLRERAQTADVVGRVRVQTVTVDKIGEDLSFHLVIQALPPLLATPRLPDTSFELNIKPQSRGYALAKAFDSRLRGLTFVGFVQRFAGPDGDPEVHFHLSPDTAEVAAAVKEAVALAELSKP